MLDNHWGAITESGIVMFAHPGFSTPNRPKLYYNAMQVHGTVKSGSAVYGFGMVISHYYNSIKIEDPVSNGDSSA